MSSRYIQTFVCADNNYQAVTSHTEKRNKFGAVTMNIAGTSINLKRYSCNIIHTLANTILYIVD